MKDPVKRRYVYLMLSIFGGIGLSVVLFFVVYRFRGVGDALNKLGSILAPFAYGGVVAYLLRPMCNLYEGLFQKYLPKKLKKQSNGLAVGLSMISGLLIVYALIIMIAPQLFSSIQTLWLSLPDKISALYAWAMATFGENEKLVSLFNTIYNTVNADLQNWANNTLAPYVSSVVSIVSGVGSSVWKVLMFLYNLLVGLIVVVFWAISNQSSIAKLYELSGMQNGSRILTTISMLAWLPNLMIWAVSWTFGAGFSIGDLAEFTLWTGQGDGLPALPLFGMMPQAVETDWVRIALMCIPLASAFATGMVVMLFNKGFHIRVGESGRNIDVKRVVLSFAYPIAAFSITSAVVSVASSLLFALGNGGLGSKHLAHVGVDVIASTRKVGQPTAMGLFSAWLLTLVAVSMFFGIRWIVKRVRESRSGASTAALESDNREVANAARTVTSTINNKEDQGDNNESTDTASSGIGLP